ncbi:hypothetical protein B0H17DRAFT_161762 [Mycena rosella]|uniref:ARID domain-containing protein n=1 Tax=Mycena rosella TaxID=1033263 RepID=A0AAD7D1U5_MYCRO|nr:hypothetical protein B0H17DRAFT_161762 [Mycena rosella]
MSLDARPIDLYELHTQVMLEGGGANVAQKDLWSLVGGRMGFVSFPASDTEPAKSGPGVAQHLAHVYKEYLAGFDHVYVSTVMESRRKNDAIARMGGAGAMGAGGANGAPQLPMRGGISDPTQMQLVMAYANIPLAELLRNQIARPPDQGGMQHPGAPFAGSPPPGNNGMMQPVGRPFMQRPGMPGPGNPMENQGQGLQRPTRETLQAAMSQITKLKTDYSPERMLSNVPMIDVPAEQRMEYNTVLEQLHRACMDLDQKLPMLYAVLKKEDVVRRLVIIIQTAVQQRAMISNGSTRFLVTLDTLRTMLNQVLHMNESFAAILQSLLGKQQPMNPNGPGLPNNGPGGMLRPPQHNQPAPPPLNPASMPQSSMSPQQQPNRPPMNLQAPPPKKQRGPNAAPSPTPPPVASASTPVTNAATPRDMAASPQAMPKSPKGKAQPKPKPPAKRKPSIKATVAPAIPAPEPPATAPSPANSNKRAREEESSPPHQGQGSNAAGPSVANEPSPPKRQKQWEGPPNDAIKARAEQVENVKTEEDGAAFLEQMTELFKMAAGNDGQDTLTSDFSETLDTIFKGFGAPADEGASGMSSLGMGDGSVPQDGGPVADEFVEFFDFSSFGTLDEDDAGSKAATPDLISSSSTNPSPESGSEVDAAHQALTSSDVKSEDFTDHLRLGVWKEVDGGESAYFHSGQWKWDSPMQTLDQPWAIFNS